MSQLTDSAYREDTPIFIDGAVKARLDLIVADAQRREAADGEPNGMTTYSGALDWALDMALEAETEMNLRHRANRN